MSEEKKLILNGNLYAKEYGGGGGGRGQLGEKGIRKEEKQGRIRTGQSEEKGRRVSKYKRKEGEKNG